MISVRLLGTLLVVLCLVGAAVSALDWKEVGTTATPKTGSDGEPVILFTLQLQYDQLPPDASLSFGWTVYELGTGEPIEISSFYRSTTFSGGSVNIYLASGRVPVEPGRRYRAHLVVDDVLNDLHFTRDIDYTSPVSLPVGLRLVADDGEEAYDLSGVPDEEIEEMATAYDALRAEYDLLAEDLALNPFFSTHASSEDAFPVTVFLIPVAGTPSPLGPANSPVTFTIIPVLYIFPIPTSAAVAGTLEQIATYDREFRGKVFSGEATEALLGGRTVFVGEVAWQALAAAAEEEAARLSP